MCSSCASLKSNSDSVLLSPELPLFTSLVLSDTPVKSSALLMRSAVMNEPFLLPCTKVSKELTHEGSVEKGGWLRQEHRQLRWDPKAVTQNHAIFSLRKRFKKETDEA